MLKKIILLPFLALLLTFAQNVTACGSSDTAGGQCQCKAMKNAMDQLSLTADQQAKIKDIRDQSIKETEAKRGEMKQVRSQIKALITSDKVDQAKLDSLIGQKKEIFASLMKDKIIAKNKIYNVLDSNQKAKFAAMMDKWEEEKAKEDQDDTTSPKS